MRQVELGVNLEDQHGPAAEWVAQEPNQRAIAKKFKNFLFSYGVDGNERIYWHRLRAVCRSEHDPYPFDFRCPAVSCSSIVTASGDGAALMSRFGSARQFVVKCSIASDVLMSARVPAQATSRAWR